MDAQELMIHLQFVRLVSIHVTLAQVLVTHVFERDIWKKRHCQTGPAYTTYLPHTVVQPTAHLLRRKRYANPYYIRIKY